jgi:hypothetical protein
VLREKLGYLADIDAEFGGKALKLL